MGNDSEYRSMRAMRLQSAAAKAADGTLPERPTGNIDFTANTPPQPFIFFRSRGATQLFNRAHKFVPGNAVKIVITVQEFHVGVTNSRQSHANEYPPLPELRRRPLCCFQLSIFHTEVEHPSA